MAQSYINLKEGYKDESLAVYNDDILIGFTKIVFVPKDVKPYYLNDDAYMIDSLIIDKAHQGEGYGKEALSVIINYCASHPFKPAEHIALVCYEENKGAQALFKSFNFQKVKQTNKTKKMILYNRHMIRNH